MLNAATLAGPRASDAIYFLPPGLYGSICESLCTRVSTLVCVCVNRLLRLMEYKRAFESWCWSGCSYQDCLLTNGHMCKREKEISVGLCPFMVLYIYVRDTE